LIERIEPLVSELQQTGSIGARAKDRLTLYELFFKQA